MPHPLDTSELLAIRIDDGVHKNLFAYPPLSLEKLFDDPMVQKRIGELISFAAQRPRKRRRHRRSL
jgi:hypothetical protein